MSLEKGQKWLIKGQELQLEHPLIMGILNVTPDSFSDGGLFTDPDVALSKAREMVAQGATIIDIGGESTRPGAKSISAEEEIDRAVPVVEKLISQTNAIISIDTQKASVAEAALRAGAHIINDVSAGRNSAEMFDLVKASGVGYILMHMQGAPKTMQQAPTYDNVIEEVVSFFKSRLKQASLAGIDMERIVLDPGIGFGKTLDHNLDLLGNLQKLRVLDRPLLLGTSRKSFIGMIDDSRVDERLGGSLAAVIYSYLQGVKLYRVHDVAETRQVLDIFTAIQKHSD